MMTLSSALKKIVNDAGTTFRDWLFTPVIEKINKSEEKLMTQFETLTQAIEEMKADQEQADIDLAAGFKRLDDKISELLSANPDLSQAIAAIQAESQSLKALSARSKAEGQPTPPAA